MTGYSDTSGSCRPENENIFQEKNMFRERLLHLLLVTALLFVFASGCASTQEASGTKHSGFLSDYSKLESDPDGSGAMRYRNPNVDMGKYNKILLERIMVVLKDDADYKAIDPDAMKAMTDYFHEAIVRELGDAYPLVDEPGTDVLRVRLAITDLVPTKTAMSVVMLVTPYATIADLASGAATEGGAGSAPYLGHTAIEGEGIDSMTLETVFLYVDQRFPKKYDIDTSEGVGKAITKGYGQYFKSYKAWSYTKDALDYWAHKLRVRLDQAHGKAEAK